VPGDRGCAWGSGLQGVQLTAYSVGSCLAPASGSNALGCAGQEIRNPGLEVARAAHERAVSSHSG
jgi:hypothetical protein